MLKEVYNDQHTQVIVVIACIVLVVLLVGLITYYIKHDNKA